MNDSKNRYQPRTASLPGETLNELLVERGMTQAELAQRMGRPKKTINEIVKGKTAITPETALELERVLGAPPASFWLIREQNYRESLARVEEEKRLVAYESEIAEWHLPHAELVRRGWIPEAASKLDKTRTVLSFFGVATPQNWKELYAEPQAKWRRTESIAEKAGKLGKIAAWLRYGEILAQQLPTAPFDREAFTKALATIRETLVAKKTLDAVFSEIKASCAQAGVAVVMVPEFQGAGVKAAARWLSPEKALIQISYLWDRLDIFWFNLFHEAAHILLHGKREVFLDEKDDAAATDLAVEEAEANRYACDLLIEPKLWRGFASRGAPTIDEVKAFARSLRVDPSIVLGRLHREKILDPRIGHELFIKLGEKIAR